MNFTKTELNLLSDLARHRSLTYRIDGNKAKMESYIGLAERLELAANSPEQPTDIVDTENTSPRLCNDQQPPAFNIDVFISGLATAFQDGWEQSVMGAQDYPDAFRDSRTGALVDRAIKFRDTRRDDSANTVGFVGRHVVAEFGHQFGKPPTQVNLEAEWADMQCWRRAWLNGCWVYYHNTDKISPFAGSVQFKSEDHRLMFLNGGNQMNTNKAELNCDNLDCAIFAGDGFDHPAQIAILRAHCERWLRHCDAVAPVTAPVATSTEQAPGDLEAQRTDALRYRFLRDKDAFGDENAPGLASWDELAELEANEFDAAIDARMRNE